MKRYVSEKVRYLRQHAPGDEHVLVIPGERDGCEEGERSRIYSIRSPLVSRAAGYRVLLRLGALERVLERERPDVIESGDPYQVAWRVLRTGATLGIPVLGFYHSHFPEVAVRSARKFLGRAGTEILLEGAQRYVRRLYNRFSRTLVPSPALGELLTSWGVRRVAETDLGVDIATFHPGASGAGTVRGELGITPEARLLLYVGRLAPEKNTRTLCAAFRLLAEREPALYHLLVVGDGDEHRQLEQLGMDLAGKAARQPEVWRDGAVRHLAPGLSWLPYCGDSARLAALYAAADLLVHPGIQETFGLVALEAQACGTPVVGIHGSYMDRIIHTGQATWAREISPAALAGAIMANSEHPPEPRGPALAAQIARRYAWEMVFQRLFAVYREEIETYPRPFV